MNNVPPSRRLIGLTGGIATGKSTVADYLHHHYQLPILDADVYARQAVEPGSAILSAIASRYGQNIFQENGELNRGALGEIIFNNAQEKQWLEFQIHPFVKQCFQTELQKLEENQTAVLVIPLLFEAELTDWVTEIWVVICGAQQQKQRLMKRNSLTEAQAQARIASQMPLAEKVAQADVVLDNSFCLGDLQTQIKQAWEKS